MRMYPFIVLASFGVLGAFLPNLGRAEGGSCPPGFYPIGGQGASGCAPIPGGAAGSGDQIPLPPRPTGEWISTWGAIATSLATSEVGMVSDMRSAELAASEAMRRCAGGGARDCKVTVSYSNQCVAWLVPSADLPGAQSAVGRAPKKRIAIAEAQRKCVDPSGKKCTVFYADCSEPVFRKF
ncbi:DUF4189 domain-containing protein [Stenotrophomonas maltophilia group sp. P373]|uniref:DUF4189 domain-containing protein n=2 Tax=Pseudomonadota TaxID=1224 RepID=UPI0028733CAA|nr:MULTISPECIES: DUF4189 domain-containing protein [Stenotrophomonas]WNB80330.1 DUF4189 domain-containing protein [Stenotrophomonas sp. 9]